MHTGKS